PQPPPGREPAARVPDPGPGRAATTTTPGPASPHDDQLLPPTPPASPMVSPRPVRLVPGGPVPARGGSQLPTPSPSRPGSPSPVRVPLRIQAEQLAQRYGLLKLVIGTDPADEAARLDNETKIRQMQEALAAGQDPDLAARALGGDPVKGGSRLLGGAPGRGSHDGHLETPGAGPSVANHGEPVRQMGRAGHAAEAGPGPEESLNEQAGPSSAVEPPALTANVTRLSSVLPEKEWWRLYLNPIDHSAAQRHHPENPGSFYDSDQSRGFQQAMARAYSQVLDGDMISISTLNWDSYESLHRLVTDATEGDFMRSEDGEPPDFELNSASPSADILNETIGGRPLTAPLADYAVAEMEGRPLPLTVHTPPVLYSSRVFVRYHVADSPALVNEVFDNLRQDIQNSRSDADKLIAIARAVRNLHVLHVFNDGNGRLNVFLLLPRLLMENGFKPVIIDGIGSLFNGGYSKVDIAKELFLGQHRPLVPEIGEEPDSVSIAASDSADGLSAGGDSPAHMSGQGDLAEGQVEINDNLMPPDMPGARHSLHDQPLAGPSQPARTAAPGPSTTSGPGHVQISEVGPAPASPLNAPQATVDFHAASLQLSGEQRENLRLFVQGVVREARQLVAQQGASAGPATGDGPKLVVHIEGGGNGGLRSRGADAVGLDRASAVHDAIKNLLVQEESATSAMPPGSVSYDVTSRGVGDSSRLAAALRPSSERRQVRLWVTLEGALRFQAKQLAQRYGLLKLVIGRDPADEAVRRGNEAKIAQLQEALEDGRDPDQAARALGGDLVKGGSRLPGGAPGPGPQYEHAGTPGAGTSTGDAGAGVKGQSNSNPDWGEPPSDGSERAATTASGSGAPAVERTTPPLPGTAGPHVRFDVPDEPVRPDGTRSTGKYPPLQRRSRSTKEPRGEQQDQIARGATAATETNQPETRVEVVEQWAVNDPGTTSSWTGGPPGALSSGAGAWSTAVRSPLSADPERWAKPSAPSPPIEVYITRHVLTAHDRKGGIEVESASAATVDFGQSSSQLSDGQRENLKPLVQYVADEVGQVVAQRGAGGGPKLRVHIEGGGNGRHAAVAGLDRASAVRDAVKSMIEDEFSASALPPDSVSYLVSSRGTGDSSSLSAALQPLPERRQVRLWVSPVEPPPQVKLTGPLEDWAGSVESALDQVTAGATGSNQPEPGQGSSLSDSGAAAPTRAAPADSVGATGPDQRPVPVTGPAAGASLPEVLLDKVTSPLEISFREDSAEIGESAHAALADLARNLATVIRGRGAAGIKVTITGYSNGRKSDGFNAIRSADRAAQDNGRRRAESVAGEFQVELGRALGDSGPAAESIPVRVLSAGRGPAAMRGARRRAEVQVDLADTTVRFAKESSQVGPDQLRVVQEAARQAVDRALALGDGEDLVVWVTGGGDGPVHEALKIGQRRAREVRRLFEQELRDVWAARPGAQGAVPGNVEVIDVSHGRALGPTSADRRGAEISFSVKNAPVPWPAVTGPRRGVPGEASLIGLAENGSDGEDRVESLQGRLDLVTADSPAPAPRPVAGPDAMAGARGVAVVSGLAGILAGHGLTRDLVRSVLDVAVARIGEVWREDGAEAAGVYAGRLSAAADLLDLYGVSGQFSAVMSDPAVRAEQVGGAMFGVLEMVARRDGAGSTGDKEFVGRIASVLEDLVRDQGLPGLLGVAGDGAGARGELVDELNRRISGGVPPRGPAAGSVEPSGAMTDLAMAGGGLVGPGGLAEAPGPGSAVMRLAGDAADGGSDAGSVSRSGAGRRAGRSGSRRLDDTDQGRVFSSYDFGGPGMPEPRRFALGDIEKSTLKDESGNVVGVSFAEVGEKTKVRDLFRGLSLDGRGESVLLEAGVTDRREANLLSVTAPWAADLGDGGTFFVDVHGSPGTSDDSTLLFVVNGHDDSKIWVDGTTFADMMFAHQGFLDAMENNVRSITLIACHVGAGTERDEGAYQFWKRMREISGKRFSVYAPSATTLISPNRGWGLPRGGITITDGGHWEIYGHFGRRHAEIVAGELAEAARLSWKYGSSVAGGRGRTIALSDRQGTLGLVKGTKAEVQRGLAVEKRVLNLAGADYDARRHERPDIIWGAALDFLRTYEERSGIQYIRDTWWDTWSQRGEGEWGFADLPLGIRQLFVSEGHAIESGSLVRKVSAREDASGWFVSRRYEERLPPPVTVQFGEGRSSASDMRPGDQMLWMAHWLAEVGAWRRARRGGLPTVHITGYGNGRRLDLSDASARETGQRRADAVRDHLRELVGRYLRLHGVVSREEVEEVAGELVPRGAGMSGRDLGSRERARQVRAVVGDHYGRDG
ncbi:MAG: hypothetical protein QOG28_961, partial [Trebonia sp.]|nr:hypothetical protein [Trebonia sp.]